MAVSLEARIPFLDHRIVEFAWTLPRSKKIDGKQTKIPLRNILSRYVPQELFNRPKMGFGVPIDEWLRGPLREWGEDLLSESRLKQQGILDSAQVQEKWRQHLSGQASWQYILWPTLMFQAWHERWVN